MNTSKSISTSGCGLRDDPSGAPVMAALSPKGRAAQRRAFAHDAIVEASTRPGFDMGGLLDEIAAERVRLDERLAMSDGEWTWDQDDLVNAMTGGEPESDDKRLTRDVVNALYDYGDDPEFRCHVQQAQLSQAMPETVERHVRTRL